jgi:hypothetical protein
MRTRALAAATTTAVACVSVVLAATPAFASTVAKKDGERLGKAIYKKDYFTAFPSKLRVKGTKFQGYQGGGWVTFAPKATRGDAIKAYHVNKSGDDFCFVLTHATKGKVDGWISFNSDGFATYGVSAAKKPANCKVNSN